MNQPVEERERHGHARKNTARWCGGHVGREHRPETIIPPNHPGWSATCGPPPEWFKDTPRYKRMKIKPNWWCQHKVVCAECQKVLKRWIRAAECPDREGNDGERGDEPALEGRRALGGDDRG